MQLPVLWNQEQCARMDFAAKTARWTNRNVSYLCGVGRIPQASQLQSSKQGWRTSKLVSLSIKTLAFHVSNSENSQTVTVTEGADQQTFLIVSVLFVAPSFAHAKPLLFHELLYALISSMLLWMLCSGKQSLNAGPSFYGKTLKILILSTAYLFLMANHQLLWTPNTLWKASLLQAFTFLNSQTISCIWANKAFSNFPLCLWQPSA